MLKKLVLIVLGVIGFVAIGYGFFKTDIKGNDPTYFVAFVATLLATLIHIWPTKKAEKKNAPPLPKQ